MESKSETFNFLHLSDLHVGLSGHEFLWPNIKKQFLDDLKVLGEKNGGWDLVIFSGDLTQKGSKEEFDRLDEYLKEIWDVFKLFDKETKLFVVPGNHDLTRLKKTSLIASFDQWWTKKAIRDEFWGGEDNEFKVAVKDAFSNYENWLENLPTIGIKLAIDSKGIISGDCAVVLNVANMKIGLIGLNSAWLQLSAGDYEAQLDIGIQQFHKVTNSDVNKWLEGNDVNLLVTHHPDHWLYKDAKDCFDNEINCAGKFHAHLFGHMHDSDSVITSIAGSASKRSIQGSSLFGLEFFNDKQERIHGYSSFELKRLDGGNKVEMRVFPRLAHKVKGAGWKLIANFHFNLKNECYTDFIDINFSDNSVSSDSFAIDPKVDQTFSALASANETVILDQLKYKLKKSERHFHIREMEVSDAIDSLRANRYLWVVSDWEMGFEEFLTVVKQKTNDENLDVYKLDLSGYISYSQFAEDSVRKIGCGFEKFFQLIAKRAPAYLILDDIPVGVSGLQVDIEKEMERLLDIILPFCESLKIVLVSRCLPKNTVLKFVELHALNEVDIRAYIKAGYEGGVSETVLANEADFIFRHTNGVPPLIDNIVKDLEVVSIDELALQEAIIRPQVLSNVNAPSSLISMISNLQNSEDGMRVDAFELLCALCAFPYGERFEVLKRFNRAKNFRLDHVHILRDCALIDCHQSLVVGAGSPTPVALLIVKRVVREYILSFLSEAQKEDLYVKAIGMYFGEFWVSGKFKINSQAKFSETNMSSNIIENSSELVRWLFAVSLDREDQKKLSLASRLLYFYLDKLEDGDHSREVASVCGTLISKVSNSKFREPVNRIKLIYAQALRMTNEYEKAIEVSTALIEEGLKEKAILARSYLNIAYCYDSLGNNELAKLNAREVEKINKGSPTARAAKALLLQLSSNHGLKIRGLQKLEAESRKNNEYVNLNNIRMNLASNITDLEEKADHYKETMLTAIKHSDGYHAVHALIFYSRITQQLNKNLSDRDKRGLMNAYQFLYSQRSPNFFGICHDVLWNEFVKDGDVENLLELFKHSSLFWRLSSNETNEIKYLKSMFDVITSSGGDKNHRGFVYLVSRSNKLNPVIEGNQ